MLLKVPAIDETFIILPFSFIKGSIIVVKVLVPKKLVLNVIWTTSLLKESSLN